MAIFLGILSGAFAIGILGDKKPERCKVYALCFCICIAALVVFNIV
ncbi:MAG: hypothetical protein HFH69_00605 [Lachnospiraceae bacterium]|nr:hypothetical protein [Lachnospiraceae bacterium]